MLCALNLRQSWSYTLSVGNLHASSRSYTKLFVPEYIGIGS